MKTNSIIIASLVISAVFGTAMAQNSNVTSKQSSRGKASAAIPQQFLGSWAENTKGCKLIKDGIDAGIFIEKTTIMLGTESSCQVSSLKRTDDKVFASTFKCESEGDISTIALSLELKKTNQLVIDGWGDKSRIFMKCGI